MCQIFLDSTFCKTTNFLFTLLQPIFLMKTIFYCFLLFFIILFSCQEKKQEAITVNSTGKINSLTVIMNDFLWNGEIGDSIRKKFASPVDGLPQEEPLFTINQYPIKALDGNKTTNRNIIIIKKEEKNFFEFKENEFASRQNVIHISGNNASEIIAHLQQHSDEMIRRIRQTEITANQTNIQKNLLSDVTLKRKFKINLKIPATYNYALVRSNFVWLKKEIVSGSNSILVYSVPLKTILRDDNVVANIVKMRDSVQGMYVQSKAKNAKMITEKAYTPYFEPIILDKKRTYQTKGTWELDGDYMSGCFINYAIIDRRKKRFVVIEGFCYAPSADKRDLMFELEAIIKSIKILK